MIAPSLKRTAWRVVLLALVVTAGTAWYGWWTVPVSAFAYGVADRARFRQGLLAAGAAVLSWSGLLAFAAARSATAWGGSERVASMLRVSPLMLMVLALLFVALLAGPAAIVGASAVATIGRRPARGGPQSCAL